MFYVGWYMWDQHELIKLQNEKIEEQREIIMQMEKLIETQFQYIEKLITPSRNTPYESPIYKRSI